MRQCVGLFLLVCLFMFVYFFQSERENECGNGEVDKWGRLGEVRGDENPDQDIVYKNMQKNVKINCLYCNFQK